jgi:hypothetical protein
MPASIATRFTPHLMRLVPFLRRSGAAGLCLAAGAAFAQFAATPGVSPALVVASAARNEQAYREDAARHLYALYPAQIKNGRLPSLLHAVAVTETWVDSRGAVMSVRLLRAPAAPQVGPWVVALIRRAAPYPQPGRMRSVRYIETWLVDKSGQFQLHTLSEGQV